MTDSFTIGATLLDLTLAVVRGIYIMLAASLDEAKAIAATDSHHARGIRTMEVLEWNPHRAFRMDKLTIADVERMARGE